MVKRFVYIGILVLLPLGLFAQKKDIAQAKTYIKSGKNLDKAEQLMTNLLKDSANQSSEKIWMTLYAAVKGQYEQGNESLYLKQKYDTATLFSTAKKMFDILERIDSIDALPDKKGMVRPKYRKRHAEYLHQFRPNLYNAGQYYIHKQNYKEAYQYLTAFIDCAQQPLFQDYHYQETDSILPIAAYWAVYCGWKMKDAKATLRHTYIALKDTTHYDLMLQYLAETYQQEEDTTRYVQTLTEGFQKYPTFPFFFTRLMEYYGQIGDYGQAMNLVEQALQVDSSNELFLFAKSTVLLNIGKYKECIHICDTLIARNERLADAYLNAGLAYFNQAIALDKNPQITSKLRKQILSDYEQSRKYLEHYRILAPDRKDQWALPLYTIYLNLNMGDEFDEMDAILRSKDERQ